MRKLVSAIAALAMVATFAMSAAAADWNFYGSARIETFYQENGTDEFSMDQAGNSRIGATVKVSDELTGRFEYGSGDNASIRLLYGEWNFGGGTLTVGQDYTPISLTSGYSQQFKNANTGLIGYGMPYAGRVPQLKLTFGNFSIAAIHNTDLEEDVQDDIAAAGSKMIMGEDGYGYDTDADNYGAWNPDTTENTALLANGNTINSFLAVRDLAIADKFASTYAGNISTEVTLPRLEAGYFYDIGVDLNENVFLLFGHFASEIMILFKNGETKTITPEPDEVEYIYTQFTPDKRGYMWMCKFPRLGEGGNLSVYDGEKWHEPETDLAFGPPNWIDVDDNNNIWIATNSGICILNQ